MREHDPEVPGAGDAGGVDELALAQRHELTAHQAGESGPQDAAQHQPQHGGQIGRQRETEEGEGGATDQLAQDRSHDDRGDDDEAVRDPHEQAVQPAAVVTGQRADRRADHQCGRTDDDHDHERDLCALHDPGEVVAADVVLPEGMLAQRERVRQRPRGRSAGVDDRAGAHVVVDPPARDGAHALRGEGEERDEAQDDHADHRARVAEELAADDRALRQAGVLLRFDRGGGIRVVRAGAERRCRGCVVCRAHQASTRIRGSRTA